MGQVIEITDRSPRAMAEVPNEERVSHGLNSLSVQEQDEKLKPVDAGNLTVAGEAEPESIFSSQFAGLADFMQSILDEKKAKDTAEKQNDHIQTQPQTQPQTSSPGQTQDGASQVSHQVHAQSDFRATSQNTASGPSRTQSQASCTGSQTRPDVQAQKPMANDTLEYNVTQLPNTSSAGINDSRTKSPGLMQSRWSIDPHEATITAMPSQTRPSEKTLPSDQGAGSAKPIVPITCSLSPSAQSTMTVKGTAQGVRTKVKEEVPPLPSGSSWW